MPTTNSAYGQSPGDTYLDEKSKLNPLSHYARDKVDIENILFEKNNFTSFRLATVFGMSPRMRLDLLVNYMVKAAIDPGYVVLFEHNARRNYIHVKDVAKVFNYAITNHDLFINQVFNVGLSDANLSKIELAERIKMQKKDFVITLSDYKSDPDKRDYLISNSKLETTGFKCDVSLEMGIEELLSGIRSLHISNYNNV
jgi:nucleoside-diphosphate-sugar epimerase